MQNILLTGASGFIGFHLMKKLSANCKLFGLDLLTENSASFHRSQLQDNIQKKDIRSTLDLDVKCDTLIHLAAETGIANSNESPQNYLEQNVKSTLNILEYCRKNQINQLLYASSSSVYEPSSQALNENAPCDNQLSFYGKTKKVCEELVDFYCKTHNIKAIGLRFFTVFGSWTRPDMAAYKFMTAIEKGNPISLYNNGKVYRDFTHVSEVINAIEALLKKWDEIETGEHKIFNVGKGEPISIKTYAETIAYCMQKELTYISKKLPSNELVHTHCDNSKLKNFVKYSEGLNFKEGIEEMVNWFKSHPYGK